jgi:hypothetical protein
MKSSLKIMKKIKKINTLFKTISIIILMTYYFILLTRERKLLDGSLEDLTLSDLVYFKYASLTSTNVERCFSKYKNLLAPPNRRALDFENLKISFSSMQQHF